jgi:hypothetical protein
MFSNELIELVNCSIISSSAQPLHSKIGDKGVPSDDAAGAKLTITTYISYAKYSPRLSRQNHSRGSSHDGIGFFSDWRRDQTIGMECGHLRWYNLDASVI